MRCFGTLILIATLLSGCHNLGLTDSDPDELIERHADRHSQFLDIEGATVHVRDEGEGPAIVLLHGVLASLHTWDDWTAELTGDYRVIRVDLPPFGLSEQLPNDYYHGPAMTALLHALLDQLDVESAVFAGNSLGGYYAAYFAAHAPDRVRALALISPAAYPQGLPLMLRLGAMPVVGKGFEIALPRMTVQWSLGRLYAVPDRVDDAVVDRYFDLNRAPNVRAGARDVMRQMVARSDQEPVWIRRIEQPTLLLWGKADRWVPPSQAERWQADLADSRLIVYDDASHVAMEEIPARTVADFREFLAAVDADTADEANASGSGIGAVE